jgi:hypothetical protein
MLIIFRWGLLYERLPKFGHSKIIFDVRAIFVSWRGGPLFISLGGPLQETRAHQPLSRSLTFLSLQQLPAMQGDSSSILSWTAEKLDRKDLFLMWKSITHALTSTGYVAELHQELDHASRTGRENLSSGSQWVVESCCDPTFKRITTNSC